MKTEIGGYFEMETFHGAPYHQNAIALNCGRGALAYLAELRHIGHIWLPDFMCDSVRKLFQREGIRISTYHIGADFLPVYDFETGSGSWMLLNDSYGQLKDVDVDTARRFSGNRLIVDETQNFFQKPRKRTDTIYSCRKWFGVADGAYLITGDGRRLERELELDESHTRMSHILGRFERPPSEFFAASRENNDFFNAEPAKRMSLLTENLMKGIEWETVKKRRSENWDILCRLLDRYNELHPMKPKVPFMYPLLLERTGDLRQRLAKRGLYIPKLWPNVPEECRQDTVAFQYAENILPLPLDQRYDAADMERVAELICKEIGK